MIDITKLSPNTIITDEMLKDLFKPLTNDQEFILDYEIIEVLKKGI